MVGDSLGRQIDSHFKSQVRVNLLSQLLDEAYGFLHSFLSASILCKKLMRHPFHRDVVGVTLHQGLMLLRAQSLILLSED